jgi:hypothetical protein
VNDKGGEAPPKCRRFNLKTQKGQTCKAVADNKMSHVDLGHLAQSLLDLSARAQVDHSCASARLRGPPVNSTREYTVLLLDYSGT